MKLSNLVDSILIYANDPNNFNLRQAIKISIVGANAMLLRREYEKTKQYRMSNIIGVNIAMKQIDIAEDCGINLGCKALRSVSKIPRPIQIKDKPDFEYVGSIGKKHSFGYISPSEIEWFENNRWSGELPRYTYMNDYIYTFPDITYKELLVRTMFPNPMDLENIKLCDGNCFNLDDVFLIDDDLTPIIKEMVYKELSLAPNKDLNQIEVNDIVS